VLKQLGNFWSDWMDESFFPNGIDDKKAYRKDTHNKGRRIENLQIWDETHLCDGQST